MGSEAAKKMNQIPQVMEKGQCVLEGWEVGGKWEWFSMGLWHH